jgi:hypothetical protein
VQALLIALAVFAGALCLLNLVLTLGVVRRLREHAERIAELSPEPPNAMRAVGTLVEPFDASSVEGRPLSREGLRGLTLVGVFSPDCPACAERLPLFLDYAGSFAGGRDQVIALVVGTPQEAADHVAALSPVAHVVVASMQDSITQALGVRGFPAFGVLDGDGRVLTAGTNPDWLKIPAAV